MGTGSSRGRIVAQLREEESGWARLLRARFLLCVCVCVYLHHFVFISCAERLLRLFNERLKEISLSLFREL